MVLHEAGHLFGLAHCVWAHCGMNGANSLAESDAAPVQWCSCCLRKLERCVPTSAGPRLRCLRALLPELLPEEREWIDRALAILDS